MTDDNTFSDLPMLELFRGEIEQQTAVLTDGLLSLEKGKANEKTIEPLMRAAHSIKGAARIVDRNVIVDVAHVVEDFFVKAQELHVLVTEQHVDVLLKTVDLISKLAMTYEQDDDISVLKCTQCDAIKFEMESLISKLQTSEVEYIRSDQTDNLSERRDDLDAEILPVCYIDTKKPTKTGDRDQDRTLRISSERLDQLIALTGEYMVQAKWLRPFTRSLQRQKRDQWELASMVDFLMEELINRRADKSVIQKINEIRQHALATRNSAAERAAELEAYDVKAESLASRLHGQVIACRMRPFKDGVNTLPRIIRDVARSLGKDVSLDMDGLDTKVDRDVLERIEAPLSHLLNNAIDHGIEDPETREAIGKPREGRLILSAYHQGGMLYISLSDDGKGIDFSQLKEKIVAKKLAKREVVDQLSEQELTEFMFLPGFSTKNEVSSLSGRGVGLDIVRDVMQAMGGGIELESVPGQGTQFKMRLPLTLSVVPSLLVKISGEPYAFPLARIDTVIQLSLGETYQKNNQQYAIIEGIETLLVSAESILDIENKQSMSRVLSVLVVASQELNLGVVVEQFLVEKELVVKRLPAQLGTVQDIAAAAFMEEDGSPILIINVDDIIQTTRNIIETGEAIILGKNESKDKSPYKKRILVVDDSITVREIERKLLLASGYDVEVAVDGLAGWNAVRKSVFDIVITDLDMPRMNGFQLTKLIKTDPALSNIPVMIVSYKDKIEDKDRALTLGADYFLEKANFHDDALCNAVGSLLEK
ncbi:Signal transduction histidine kinase CheA [hydrothermal vent metagenome]|uniref:histidine kinase n=1 Tax=hydrothermal vent metagenome TaxID=652676 RepID=A0A3B0ZF79_9ZZZZ